MPEPWLQETIEKWRAGIAHTFILHGNVDDLMSPGICVKDALLASGLVASREIVINYDRSRGIDFPIPSHRQAFMEVVGLQEQVPPALAALQQVRGQQTTQLPTAPGSALPLIEKALPLVDEDQKSRTAVIIDHAETIFPNTDISAMSPEDRNSLVTILRWAKEREFTKAGPPIFLLVENPGDLHISLRRASSRIEAVKVPYPDYVSRLEFIQQLAKGKNISIEESPEWLASVTAGLKKVHIEDLFLRADLDGSEIAPDLVRERKEEIVRSEFAEILEITEPRVSFDDIGGLDYVKEFFLKNVVKPMREGNAARVPMGVLLLGPPGTGKTVLAEAVAKESGMNCASLDVGKILGSYVGQSERNLERALECIRSLAPTIVIVDEIDQAGLNRTNSGDSGVSNRVFRRLLEFMSDTSYRGKVLWLGLSNRPDLLDAALKRPGRFDKKVPILVPEPEEREAIFRVMFRKYAIPYEVKEWFRAVEATEGWTGAEIEALVLKAYEVAGEDPVTEVYLDEALDRYFPTTQDIEAMTTLAVAECNDADLLPPRYRAKLQERRKVKVEEPFVRSRRAI